MKLKVIAKLKDIPENATITKINGNTKYVQKKKITVYTTVTNNKPQIIFADSSCVFLVSSKGNVNACSKETEVVWYTNLDTLNSLEEEKESK